jgi:hypothetical protein
MAGESAAADAQAPLSRAPWSRRSSAASPGAGEDGGLRGGLRFVVTSRTAGRFPGKG